VDQIEILKLYIYRNGLKKSIQKYCEVTLEKEDRIKRGELHNKVADEMGIVLNNKVANDIKKILIGADVKEIINSGKKYYRGVKWTTQNF
jgi:hypothetical protein